MTGVANKPPADPAPPREARVLLVDDDRELCQMLTEYLEAEHFDVKSVHDGGDALDELKVNDFEILILDVMLPSVGGFDVLRELGASYDTPILMLTARGDDVDRIVGLELGADDYLSKPVDYEVLAARISARLERVARSAVWPAQVKLREREVETLTWAARGKTFEEIGKILSLSKRTVEFHLDNARKKLGVATRTQALIKAATGRLIPL